MDLLQRAVVAANEQLASMTEDEVKTLAFDRLVDEIYERIEIQECMMVGCCCE